jgi:hypothetical protein
MKQTTLRFLFTSVAVLTFLFVFVSSAYAADISQLQVEDKNDFVLEPGKSEFFLNPGDTVVKEIMVTSRIKGETKFRIQVEDFEGSRNPEQPIVILDNKKGAYSSRDFLTPEIEEFTLTFGERIRVPITLKIPSDAQPGGYYSTVLVSNEPSATVGPGASTRVISRIGTLSYFALMAMSTKVETWKISDLKIKPNSFTRKGLLPSKFCITTMEMCTWYRMVL